MNEKTRSDFWKCTEGALHWKGLGSCEFFDPFTDEKMRCKKKHTATNVEVLIAWLSADDERRHEIEIASRPTKAGWYTCYGEGLKATLSSTKHHLIDHDFNVVPQQLGGLWEPIE